MPEFEVRIGTPGGDIRVEMHVAADEKALRDDFDRRNVHVFAVKRKTAGVGIGALRFGGKVKRRDFLLFNQQMVALIRAGLPLLQALDVILERMKPGPFRQHLADVRQRVQAGSALSEAFAAQGDAFPRIYGAALTAGERSGELATVMSRYLQFAKKSEHVRTKVRAAMIYPAVLTVLSIIVVCVLVFVALPKFAEFYQEFEAELPWLTETLISSTTWMRTHWPIPLALVLGLAVGFVSWHQTEAGRLLADRILLKLPFLGPIMREYNVAQFSRTLSTLLAGGIPLVPSLQTTGGALGNKVFVLAIAQIAEDVRQGRALYDSIERTGTMTDLTIELVKVGESTGSLDVMLTNVAEFYDEQVDDAMTRLISAFEPMILIVMGVVIGGLLYSMYVPIFKAAAAAGNV